MRQLAYRPELVHQLGLVLDQKIVEAVKEEEGGCIETKISKIKDVLVNNELEVRYP